MSGAGNKIRAHSFDNSTSFFWAFRSAFSLRAARSGSRGSEALSPLRRFRSMDQYRSILSYVNISTDGQSVVNRLSETASGSLTERCKLLASHSSAWASLSPTRDLKKPKRSDTPTRIPTGRIVVGLQAIFGLNATLKFRRERKAQAEVIAHITLTQTTGKADPWVSTHFAEARTLSDSSGLPAEQQNAPRPQ